MKKVFVTPDIAPQFRRVMKTLTLFDRTELLVASEVAGQEYSVESLIHQITAFEPTLIITRSQEVVRYFTSLSKYCKVISLASCGTDCDRTFLSNALVLNAFMTSNAKTFEIK